MQRMVRSPTTTWTVPPSRCCDYFAQVARLRTSQRPEPAGCSRPPGDQSRGCAALGPLSGAGRTHARSRRRHPGRHRRASSDPVFRVPPVGLETDTGALLRGLPLRWATGARRYVLAEIRKRHYCPRANRRVRILERPQRDATSRPASSRPDSALRRSTASARVAVKPRRTVVSRRRPGLVEPHNNRRRSGRRRAHRLDDHAVVVEASPAARPSRRRRPRVRQVYANPHARRRRCRPPGTSAYRSRWRPGRSRGGTAWRSQQRQSHHRGDTPPSRGGA